MVLVVISEGILSKSFQVSGSQVFLPMDKSFCTDDLQNAPQFSIQILADSLRPLHSLFIIFTSIKTNQKAKSYCSKPVNNSMERLIAYLYLR